jgi:hypothetical protein
MFFYFKIILKTIFKLEKSFCFKLNSSFCVVVFFLYRLFMSFSMCLDLFLSILNQNWIKNKFIGIVVHILSPPPCFINDLYR